MSKGSFNRTKQIKQFKQNFDEVFPGKYYGAWNENTKHWLKNDDGEIVLDNSSYRMEQEIQRLFNPLKHKLVVKRYCNEQRN